MEESARCIAEQCSSDGTTANSIAEIIEGGYCIGCGACSATASSPFTIELDKKGQYQAKLKTETALAEPEALGAALAACPFSGIGPDEDELASELYPASEGSRPHERIGRHIATYAGHVADGEYRDKGSSGGMGSWILCELMARDLVDAVIHVGAADEGREPLFRFQVSRTPDEVRAAAKSRYYPVEMSGVLQEVRANPGRYALVGLPCFIKAFRLLARQDSELRDRVPFTLAIVCGHLKSTRFADLFAWQAGIEPGKLEKIDFRHKIAGQNASHYGIEVVGAREGERTRECRTNVDYYGSNWGYGFFKYRVCDYCDDVLGETADVAVGDAWIPGYVEDSGGNNVVVVRNRQLAEIIGDAIANGRLHLDDISADQVAQSQDAGLRHRRDGLAYRLHLANREGRWCPPKRVRAREDHLGRRQKKIFRLREELAKESHEAFSEAIEKGSFAVFRSRMAPLVARYDALYAPPLWRKIYWALWRRARDLLVKIDMKPKGKA